MLPTPINIPITTIVRVTPKAGFEKQTFDWFHSMTETASHFSGHLGSEIFGSCDRAIPNEIINIFYFDNYENLVRWERSEERKKQMENGAVFFEQTKATQQLTGLEYWFAKEGSPIKKVPAKWKMLAITIATIFTLLNTIVPLFQRSMLAMNLPEVLSSLFSVILLVGIMTYGIMPLLTRILAPWLFAGSSASRR